MSGRLLTGSAGSKVLAKYREEGGQEAKAGAAGNICREGKGFGKVMARDERIFIIILIVNLIVSLVYLLAGILFIVPAHAAAEKEDGAEILYDNRRTYLLRFIVMILCPVIGPLFFFMAHLFYLVVFWRDVDLADVIFSKERVRTHMKADEERERDIIPLEEAILVNEKKNLRMVMMNVIKEDFRNCLASITLALDSEDSEASHYAAAVLSDELNKFRICVQRLWKQMQEEDAEQTECEEMLLDYMDSILKQHIFSSHEQRKFVSILTEAAESLYGKEPAKFQLKWYEEVCLRNLEVKDFGSCEKWCGRMAEQFPEELPSYTCRLKLYFARQDREAFFETLGVLKKSNVVIDSETLELIRIFS